MWTIASKFNVLLGLLSMLMLIKLGWSVGFVAPLETMLQWYQALVEFLLGWADPVLDRMLDRMRDWLPLNFKLYPHWKHVFVLMWLYFAADFRQYWVRGRTVTGPFTLVIGGLVALVASVASATVTLDNPSMLAVIFPVAGFVVYEMIKAPWSATLYRRDGDTWWQTCRFYLTNFALANAAVGGVAVVFGLLASELQFKQPNLLALMVFVVGLGIRNVIMGARFARVSSHEGGSWMSRFNKSASGRLGRAIIEVVGAVIIVVTTNAGLKLAGLP